MTKPNNNTRVQLELPEQSYERLKSLKAKTEATTYAEVIRNAMRVYEALVNEADKGGVVYVKRPGGEELPVFALPGK